MLFLRTRLIIDVDDHDHTLFSFKLLLTSAKMLGTVQTAIDAAKNFLIREQDRIDGRPLWRSFGRGQS
ncbi:hypothetical protein BpHYR1_013125 [Brachionus plicatilis]|uniref:Uncharacterized protein n=1 Tax=Brachionus plicatilis TaxID=10195 RepID=A0A3M7Q8U7_BRAPC|nr:hypothetical protein BpHYR1_013125 [Brachionus plicatilis]